MSHSATDHPAALSWDPGVEAGYAFWRRNLPTPALSGVIAPPRNLPWQERVNRTGDELVKLIELYAPKVVWCEWPTFMQDSEGGQKSAKTGDLIKLAAAVGIVMRVCYNMRVEFVPVQVNDWKGQMSKESVEYRIKRVLGAQNCTGIRSHAWDAVGIGLHMIGRFG